MPQSPTTPAMLSEERLAEIAARAEAATKGPWLARPLDYDDWGTVRTEAVGPDHGFVVANARHGRDVSDDELNEHRRAKTDPYGHNTDFIAQSRTDVPALLSHIASQAQTIATRDFELRTERRASKEMAEQVAAQAAEVERLTTERDEVSVERDHFKARRDFYYARASDLVAQMQRLPDEFKRRGSLPADHPDTFMNAADAHAWLCEVAEAALARASEAPTQADEAPCTCIQTFDPTDPPELQVHGRLNDGGCPVHAGEVPAAAEATDTLAVELARALSYEADVHSGLASDAGCIALEKARARGLLPTVTDGGEK